MKRPWTYTTNTDSFVKILLRIQHFTIWVFWYLKSDQSETSRRIVNCIILQLFSFPVMVIKETKYLKMTSERILWIFLPVAPFTNMV